MATGGGPLGGTVIGVWRPPEFGGWEASCAAEGLALGPAEMRARPGPPGVGPLLGGGLMVLIAGKIGPGGAF
ncbi:hypothetical protein NDU88_004565 [Pleurodeles waltl]|uniref:Uncharacterized protein n=1 Tax=Pleurodeles waltl TaxID=8319 RepID=A0AAV7NN11_PLEWA|nr:hypothetical protein NDU88_004565 [Pleurodeles waltl]